MLSPCSRFEEPVMKRSTNEKSVVSGTISVTVVTDRTFLIQILEDGMIDGKLGLSQTSLIVIDIGERLNDGRGRKNSLDIRPQRF